MRFSTYCSNLEAWLMLKMLLKYTLASTDTGNDRMQVYTGDTACNASVQHPVLQHALVRLLVFITPSQFAVSVGLLHPRHLQK